MVSFESLKFDPRVQSANPFAAGKVAFTGGGAEETSGTGYENYGTGKGVNGINSSGVHGEVAGTGENGMHRLNMYM